MTFKNSITWIHLTRNKTDSSQKTIQRVGIWLSEEKNCSQPDQRQTRIFKYNQIIQPTAGLEGGGGREEKLNES